MGSVTSLTVAEMLGGFAALSVGGRVCSFCCCLTRDGTAVSALGLCPLLHCHRQPRISYQPFFSQRSLRSTYHSFIPKLGFKIEERKNACRIISTRERGVYRERERESLTSCPPVVVFPPFMHFSVFLVNLYWQLQRVCWLLTHWTRSSESSAPHKRAKGTITVESLSMEYRGFQRFR